MGFTGKARAILLFRILCWLVDEESSSGVAGFLHVASTKRRSNHHQQLHLSFLVDPVTTTTTSTKAPTPSSPANQRPHLCFPGGGIYFYWQAGVVTYLREKNYDLSQVTVAGASAGALTATLTAANVDFDDAYNLAIQLSKERGLWDDSNQQGLQGIWGDLVEDWLFRLLPENAAAMVNEQDLVVVVSQLPFCTKRRKTGFTSKEELIMWNMASIHLPWFLNGKLVFQATDEKLYIDGSFLSQPRDYEPVSAASQIYTIGHGEDPKYQSSAAPSFVELLQPEGIYQLLLDGKEYARKLDEEGAWSGIPKLIP